MKFIHLLFFITPFVISGCASSSFMPSGKGGSFAIYNGDIEILYNMPKNKSFIRLGTVKAQGTIAHGEDILLNELKKKAARHGAHAIVIIHKRRGSFSWSRGYVTTMSAGAIRFN